jgi:hypothetical protein
MTDSIQRRARRMLKPGPERAMLDRLVKRVKGKRLPEDEMRAQRRSWAIGELMLARPEMPKEEAERRIDAALGSHG